MNPRQSTNRFTRDIIVVGASAGGVAALKSLVAMLPEDLPAAVFIVLHTSPSARSQLAEILARNGPLPAVAPADMTHFEHGHIYVAPTDCHMLIDRQLLRVVRGPKENRHRPAIDPLFRSAAWSFGPRVVGVVLTGLLDDGAAGLWAIRTCGGTAVVQDPADALHPEMPEHALVSTQVDHCLPLERIPALLDRLAREPVDTAQAFAPPAAMKTEVEFATMERNRDITDMGSLGKLSPFTCPACRGALWELQEDALLRYRCHTGHAFGSESLLMEQTGAIEEGLYSALRAVEEKSEALRRLSARWKDRFPDMERRYLAKADEMDQSARVLRKLLSGGEL